MSFGVQVKQNNQSVFNVTSLANSPKSQLDLNERKTGERNAASILTMKQANAIPEFSGAQVMKTYVKADHQVLSSPPVYYSPDTFQGMKSDELVNSYFQIMSSNPEADFSQTAKDINKMLDEMLLNTSALGNATVKTTANSQPLAVNLANYYAYLANIGVDINSDEYLKNLRNVYQTNNTDGTTRYQTATSEADKTRFAQMGASPLAADIIQASKKIADEMPGSGWCAKGVRKAFEAIGIDGVRAAHAYQMAPKLAKDKRFNEVAYLDRKPGDVMIYPQAPGHTSGHAEILQENGMATSDTYGREGGPTKYGAPPRVFRHNGTA